MAADVRNKRVRWPLLLLVVAACSAPDGGEEQRTEAASALDAVSEVQAPDVEGETVATGPGARLADRQAMEEADAVFPHSEHRALECRRCHARPPGHATHTTAECATCHGRPAGFDRLPTRTAEECASCHHANVTSGQCSSCHEGDRVGTRPMLVSIQAAAADEPEVRRIPFDHSRHASQECASCHTTPGTLRFGRECGSCHEGHHRQEAQCVTCHLGVGAPAHDATVHSGCAGAGCHETDLVSTLEPTRNVCLVCHQDLAEHRPGRACIDCHAGSWSEPERGARRSGR